MYEKAVLLPLDSVNDTYALSTGLSIGPKS